LTPVVNPTIQLQQQAEPSSLALPQNDEPSPESVSCDHPAMEAVNDSATDPDNTTMEMVKDEGEMATNESDMASHASVAAPPSPAVPSMSGNKKAPKASEPSPESGESGGSTCSQASSTDPATYASRLVVGSMSLTDLFEALDAVGGNTSVWTREEIASAFFDLSNEELADLDFPVHQKPEYMDDILRSKILLRVIRIGTLKLGQFLQLLNFDEQGFASNEAICKAWVSASEKDRQLRERLAPRLKFFEASG
jgi:hypothetical protein